MNKTVGITHNVLKHVSILFFQGAVNLRFQRNKLRNMYKNSSLDTQESLKILLFGICLLHIANYDPGGLQYGKYLNLVINEFLV